MVLMAAQGGAAPVHRGTAPRSVVVFQPHACRSPEPDLDLMSTDVRSNAPSKDAS
jgi:hypothetical protein